MIITAKRKAAKNHSIKKEPILQLLPNARRYYKKTKQINNKIDTWMTYEVTLIVTLMMTMITIQNELYWSPKIKIFQRGRRMKRIEESMRNPFKSIDEELNYRDRRRASNIL